MPKLSEHTLIPLGVAIAVIGGGAWYLSGMDRQVSAHDKRIEKVEDKQSAILQGVNDLQTDVTIIKRFMERRR